MEFCNHLNNLNKIIDITYNPNLPSATFNIAVAKYGKRWGNHLK